MLIRLFILLILISASAQAKVFTPTPLDKPSFEAFFEWRDNFRPYAIDAGVLPEVYDLALEGQLPDSSIIKLDRKQFERPGKPKGEDTRTEAEKQRDWVKGKQNYLNRVLSKSRIKTARKLYRENKDLLRVIEKKTGVGGEFVVALWGLESNFGQNTGGFSVVNALATLAYEGRRREFFEGELINALKIVQEGHIRLEDMNGSWAGAMGQSQFMPTSWFKYAVDYNGDGKRDIWGTKQDVFASIANYLKTEGWSNKLADRESTLMHWNRSSYFVASVLQLAGEIKRD